MTLRDRMWKAKERGKRSILDLAEQLEWWALNRRSGTTVHYFDFEDAGVQIDKALDQNAWDRLRESDSVFGIPRTRDAWEASADDPIFISRAHDVVQIVDRLGARSLASYGVGGATVELNIARLAPTLDLVCTEYAERNVVHLQQLFAEARTLQHDLTEDEPLDVDLHLFHRVDTELSNEQWQALLGRLREPVLFVPGSLLNWDRFVIERRARQNPHASRAGFVRTEAAFRSLWRRTHRDESLTIGELRGYLLSRR